MNSSGFPWSSGAFRATCSIVKYIAGANLSHKRRKCSFCTILKEYEITDKILDQIGAIVNAADSVNDLLPPPEAAGLDLICRGLTKVLHDDLKVHEVGGLIFDAIYKQLTDQT